MNEAANSYTRKRDKHEKKNSKWGNNEQVDEWMSKKTEWLSEWVGEEKDS